MRLDATVKRIALGTAQFGMKYGIANKAGKLPPDEVYSLFALAAKEGIDTLDTAYLYGESEKLIGEFNLKHRGGFRVVSKFPDLGDRGRKSMEVYLSDTLKRLKLDSIYGYMAHKFDNLVKDARLIENMESLKQRALVEKTGFSIYNTEELEYLLDNDIRFDIVQVPYSILDRRFEEYFEALKERGVEIHTRSVFLQGLFFLDTDEIGRKFIAAKDAMDKLRTISREYDIPVQAICLSFALLNRSIDKVVIGVDSAAQLTENMKSIRYLDKVDEIYSKLKDLGLHDEDVISPLNWK